MKLADYLIHLYLGKVPEVPRGLETDGHKVLIVKQINKTDWEIVIKN